MPFWPNGALDRRGAARSYAVTTRIACSGARTSGLTALGRWWDLARENPGSSGEASGKVRWQGSHHSELATVVVPVGSDAPVIGSGLRVGLQHGEAKGKVRESPIGDRRCTWASSSKQRQQQWWQLQNQRRWHVSNGWFRWDAKRGSSVEVVRGLVGEEMARAGKGATAGTRTLLKWARLREPLGRGGLGVSCGGGEGGLVWSGAEGDRQLRASGRGGNDRATRGQGREAADVQPVASVPGGSEVWFKIKVQTNSNSFKLWLLRKKGPYLAWKFWNKIWLWKFWRKEQLSP
jgi:hypothetical protein